MCVAVLGVVLATRQSGEGRLGMGLTVVTLDPEGGLKVANVRKGGLPIRRRSRDGADSHVEVPAHWSWPSLWAFLTASEWTPGEPRVLGTVTLFSEGTRLKVCFNDKDAGEVGFATLEADEPLLDALERLLREDKVDWRKPKPAPQKR